MNVYSTTVLDCDNTTAAAWEPLCSGSGGSFCSKPGILTTGVNALWIGVEGDATSERDNGRFNCTGPLTTAAQIRAAVNNPANWVTDQLTPNESYNPAGCTFFGPPLPLGLLSFTGTSNPDLSVTLQWKMADQQLIEGFIVEKSLDAGLPAIGILDPASGHGLIYAFTDGQMTPGNNYYRLKILQQSGVIAYSEILVLKNTATELIRFYPNPVTDRLTIQQSGPKPI
ncbi:MAG: hypothetical protein IPI66_01065 [Chitinophagaceae bacterium]|nr:hypothetical protein [Chitinophagaceae bacterium]